MKTANFIDMIKTLKGKDTMTASELLEILKEQARNNKFDTLDRIIYNLFDDLETIEQIQKLLK